VTHSTGSATHSANPLLEDSVVQTNTAAGDFSSAVFNNSSAGVKHAVLQHATGIPNACTAHSNGLLPRIILVLLVPHGNQVFHSLCRKENVLSQ
jgi:hypothetical protein